jgi:hypothetical protein
MGQYRKDKGNGSEGFVEGSKLFKKLDLQGIKVPKKAKKEEENGRKIRLLFSSMVKLRSTTLYSTHMMRS